MSGIYVDGELSLSAEYWIEQPPGFPTVDLKGAYDPYRRIIWTGRSVRTANRPTRDCQWRVSR